MLHIHRAERADRLVGALGELLAAPLADPMAPEVVAVPTRGVERWLTQRLSSVLGARVGRRDGVCANVEFPFPGRLAGGAIAAATGVEPAEDPWRAERLVWPLLEIVDGALEEPWLGALAAHLGAGHEGLTRRARRFGAVRHVADLYDRYGVHRPEMLRAWAAGEDADGWGRALPGDMAWQATLWRRLREGIAAPSPAERLEEACERLREEPDLLDLPPRISLFGLTRLPRSYLAVLRALATGRDVHLFLLHPSPVLWRSVSRRISTDHVSLRRADDATARLPRHPLLASWGRDAREMQLVLAAGGDGAADDHRPLSEPATSLLARIQADVREDRPPLGPPLPGAVDERPTLYPGDRSLRVHACHGRARQVEVVRDAILHLLADDPTLEPRDVIVMCPDIETFAPLVHATFGAGEPEGDEGGRPSAGPPDLRVRLADRSLRQTNPVLGVVAELIDLAAARVTASQVLDLASREPVRRRFGLDDDDLASLEEWVSATGVRWGLDADHRGPFKLGSLAANTWRAGLDRVLAGVAMAEEDQRLLRGVLPLDGVGSGDIDLAGRLAEMVERLGAALDALRGPGTLAEWTEAIARAADALTLTADAEAWQRAQLERLLGDVRAESAAAGVPSAARLELAEVRALLADRLRGRPTRANFRTGHLTICTLVPMRSVPHRVVCLLGLDDGVFPRHTERDGDDILLAEPHVGDRDGRGEDRQLLLDALMAAGDHLVVTYTGRDERTNAERPPAVPVGELLDVVDRTVRLEDGRPAREGVLVRHPLQTFDPRNFSPDGVEPGRVWGFDPAALEGARALTGPRRARPPFLPAPLPPLLADVVELEGLVRFVHHPVRAFLRRRLGIGLFERGEEAADALPVELNALERWAVGDRLVGALLAGADPDACLAAERARGQLPPGMLGEPTLDELMAEARLLVEEAAREGAGDPGAAEVDLVLPDGRRLVGSVPDVCGDRIRTVTFSRLGPRPRLAAWVRLLALAAARPGEPVEAVAIGRRRPDARGRSRVSVARIAGVPMSAALEHLRVLVDLHDRGMREPLPLYAATSAAYAAAASRSRDAREAARKAWESDWERSREDAEPEHRLVLGGQLAIDRLLEEVPRDDEAGEGWASDEATRLGRCARRLWDPLLAAETVTDR